MGIGKSSSVKCKGNRGYVACIYLFLHPIYTNMKSWTNPQYTHGGGGGVVILSSVIFTKRVFQTTNK